MTDWNEQSYYGGEKRKKPSSPRAKVLLYASSAFVVATIYLTDSFSTWKFMAVLIPLAFSFISFKRWGILLGTLVIVWSGAMIMSVGTIFNHDLLELTGPLVCPEGYVARAGTTRVNPVPGETYISSRLVCVKNGDVYYPPQYKPHFTFLLLYLLAAVPLYLINLLLLYLLNKKFGKTMFNYIFAALVYFTAGYFIWINQSKIFDTLKSIL